jgi:hypothetical protein
MAITAMDPGMSLAHSVVPSSGSTAMSTLGPVALALADDNGAVDGQAVEFATHGVNGGLIGGLLVAASTQPGGSHRRALGHAYKLKSEDTLDNILLFNNKVGHKASIKRLSECASNQAITRVRF